MKMPNFFRSEAEYLAALAFLCCHYIFDSYGTSFTLCFNTVYVYFHMCTYSNTAQAKQQEMIFFA